MTTTSDSRRLAATCAGLLVALLLTGCAGGQDQAAPAVAASTPVASTPTDAPAPRAAPITATPTPRTATATASAAPAADALLPPSVVDYADPRAVADAYTRARGRYTWTDPAGYARAQTAAELATPALAARSVPGPTSVDRLVTAQESSGVTAIATAAASAPAGQPPAGDATAYVTCTFTATVTYRGAAAPDVEDRVWTLRLQRRADAQWRVDAVTAAAAADPVEAN